MFHCMYIPRFLYSSGVGHLVHHLVIVKNAAMSSGVQISLPNLDFNSLGIYPKWNCCTAWQFYIVLYIIFLRNLPILLSIVTKPFYIPSNSVPGLQFLYPHQQLPFGVLITVILTGMRWYLIWYAFLWWLVSLSIFHIPAGHLYVFFEEMPIKIFVSIFNWVI